MYYSCFSDFSFNARYTNNANIIWTVIMAAVAPPVVLSLNKYLNR